MNIYVEQIIGRDNVSHKSFLLLAKQPPSFVVGWGDLFICFLTLCKQPTNNDRMEGFVSGVYFRSDTRTSKGSHISVKANQQEARVHLWKTTTKFHLPHQLGPTFTQIVTQKEASLFSAVVKEKELSIWLT